MRESPIAPGKLLPGSSLNMDHLIPVERIVGSLLECPKNLGSHLQSRIVQITNTGHPNYTFSVLHYLGK